jgi:hypothetical protein
MGMDGRSPAAASLDADGKPRGAQAVRGGAPIPEYVGRQQGRSTAHRVDGRGVGGSTMGHSQKAEAQAWHPRDLVDRRRSIPSGRLGRSHPAHPLPRRLLRGANGCTPADASAAELAAVDAGLQGLGVSLDGLAPLHDMLRGVPDSFDAALSTLKRAHAAGLMTSVNTQIGGVGHARPAASNRTRTARISCRKSWHHYLLRGLHGLGLFAQANVCIRPFRKRAALSAGAHLLATT